MTRLIIVRHGETEANRLGLLVGHMNYPLTELGQQQAQETAAHLAGERIDAVYASDLIRAVDTARPHAERRGLPLVTSKELREVFCGEWEDIPFDVLRETEPERYTNGLCKDFLNGSLPGGESVWEGGQRFYREVLRIARAHEGETVLIAAHGGVIRSFWAYICHTPREIASEQHPYPSNSSYSEVHFDGEHLIPVAYSQDSHLTHVTKLHM